MQAVDGFAYLPGNGWTLPGCGEQYPITQTTEIVTVLQHDAAESQRRIKLFLCSTHYAPEQSPSTCGIGNMITTTTEGKCRLVEGNNCFDDIFFKLLGA